MRFRKKPVVIEAVQYALNEYADNPYTFSVVEAPGPQWLTDAIKDKKIVADFRTEDYWYLVIKTLEGEMLASPGDWIIRGVNGEIYPCKDEIFKKTYEEVTE